MSNNRRRVRTIDYVALQGLQLATMAATATATTAETETVTLTATSPAAPVLGEVEAEVPTSAAAITTTPPVPPIRLRRELNVDEDAR